MDEMHPCLTHQIVLKIYQRRADYALAEVEELMHNRFHSGDCYILQRRVNMSMCSIQVAVLIGENIPAGREKLTYVPSELCDES